MKRISVGLVLSLCISAGVFAQQNTVENWAALAGLEYRMVPNVVYKRANGFECKLDVIAARSGSVPRPTVIYIHGGGWVAGSKETSLFELFPYLARGFNVVNVEYRLGEISLAPAAVEDCRCALRWVYRNAKEHGFDLSRLVVTGHSAGGHLSLMTGMLDPSGGFDNDCPGNEDLKVAAIVNFFGVTDVGDVLEGANRQNYAVRWFGSLTRGELARRVSPITYVRSGLPPILTIHGDADTTVPYSHATRLHEKLSQAGVVNQLLTIPKGRHGGHTREQTLHIQETIFRFLKQNGIVGAE